MDTDLDAAGVGDALDEAAEDMEDLGFLLTS